MEWISGRILMRVRCREELLVQASVTQVPSVGERVVVITSPEQLSKEYQVVSREWNISTMPVRDSDLVLSGNTIGYDCDVWVEEV